MPNVAYTDHLNVTTHENTAALQAALPPASNQTRELLT